MTLFNLKIAVREQLDPDGTTGRLRFCLLILLGTAVACLNLLESAWFMYFSAAATCPDSQNRR